jgi:hypothetical protein
MERKVSVRVDLLGAQVLVAVVIFGLVHYFEKVKKEMRGS